MFPNSPVLTSIHLQNHEFGQCQKGFYAELINPVALQDPINQNKSKMTFKESKNENTVIVSSKDVQPTKKCIMSTARPERDWCAYHSTSFQAPVSCSKLGSYFPTNNSLSNG